MRYELVALLGCCAGLCFSGIGIAYKAGQNVNIMPMQTFAFAALAGAVLYSSLAVDAVKEAPLILYLLAATAGIFQYLAVRLMKAVLKFGPLSPAWSAVMLSFIPTIIFSSVILHEKFTIWNLAALTTAVIAVLSAAANAGAQNTKKPEGGKTELQLKTTIVYALLLILLIGADMVLGSSMKFLETQKALNGAPLMKQCRMVFLGIMYTFLAIPLLLDVTITGKWNFKSRRWLPLSGLAAAGTLGGMAIISSLVNYPAALIFTCNASASVLSAALFGVFLFKEKRTIWWFCTIGFTIITVFLTNGEFFKQLLHL